MGKGKKQRKRELAEKETFISEKAERNAKAKRVLPGSTEPKTTSKTKPSRATSTDPAKEGKHNLKVAYFFSALTVLLLIYFIYLAVLWRHIRDAAVEAKESETCVSCKYLRWTDMLKVLPQQGTDELQCCGKASRIFQEMVGKFTEERFKEESRNRHYAFSFPGCNENLPRKPAAKVSGISHSSKQESGELIRIYWNTTSFQKDGLSHVNGSLEITETAIYYVSFQVTYGASHLTSESSKTVLRTHVNKQSPSSTDNTILIESIKSPCDVETEKYVTAASGAIFQLEKDDSVFVSTSHPETLCPSEELNFFTIHKLQ